MLLLLLAAVVLLYRLRRAEEVARQVALIRNGALPMGHSDGVLLHRGEHVHVRLRSVDHVPVIAALAEQLASG
jgi:hypothetical protein